VISLDGAALIATVYPVGVLILVFEMRSALSWVGRELRGKPAWKNVLAGYLLALVGAATASTLTCVESVSGQQPMSATAVGIVYVTGWALVLTVTVGMGLALREGLDSSS